MAGCAPLYSAGSWLDRHHNHPQRTLLSEVEEIERISQEVEGLLRKVSGTKYVLAERISAGYYTDVRYDLARLGRHGVTADEAMLTVRYGIGGDNLLGIKQPDSIIVPLAVQYSAEYLDTVEKVRNTRSSRVTGRQSP